MLAFSFILQNNFQRAAFLNSTGTITGSIINSYNNITEYLSLRKANSDLVKENEILRNMIAGDSKKRWNFTTNYISDSSFRYIGAKVIKNSINRQKNYLMLDKGVKDGIGVDMGVVSVNGVVGTVIQVSENYSLVMSVLNISNKINARIKKNNHTGSIEWDGKNYRKGLLTDIPTHVMMYKGDTIVTSGNSHIFPKNILIGTINEYISEKEHKFNKATVDFSVDYNNVYYVYVISNLMKEEQMKLQEAIDNGQ
jgi:rod shape-determining protein MreC